jgi:hypothetical protein
MMLSIAFLCVLPVLVLVALVASCVLCEVLKILRAECQVLLYLRGVEIEM